jgi:hypothetical protein
MARFWNKKTPAVTLILFGIVDVSLFIAVSADSRFGYWPPAILLVTILLTIVNNFRIDRMEAKQMNLSEEGGAKDG